jgi:hypothetical protein
MYEEYDTAEWVISSVYRGSRQYPRFFFIE